MSFNKIRFFIDYFKYLDNPISTLKFKFGLKEKCDVKIKKKDITFTIDNITILNTLMVKIKYVDDEKFSEFVNTMNQINNNEKIITINDINYINLWNREFLEKNPTLYKNVCLFEYFNNDEWNMINFKNRNVIDIGSNIADTSLYFAKMGATVIGFEPVKELYELGLKNLKLNPKISNKISLFNNGVGGKRGKMNMNEPSVKQYITENTSYKVDIITINDVLDNNEFAPDILKMDCEGCEFEIILKNDLSMFNDIIFEYHSYITGIAYQKLIKKLKKQNFNIDIYPVNSSDYSLDDIGIIHAYK